MRAESVACVPQRPTPILFRDVSLGLYGDNRKQGGGKLNVISGEGMKKKTIREDLKNERTRFKKLKMMTMMMFKA